MLIVIEYQRDRLSALSVMEIFIVLLIKVLSSIYYCTVFQP